MYHCQLKGNKQTDESACCIVYYAGNSLGLKGLVNEMHCCPSCTKPDTSVTSLVQVLPVVVSTVSGHAPDPPRH